MVVYGRRIKADKCEVLKGRGWKEKVWIQKWFDEKSYYETLEKQDSGYFEYFGS